MPIPDYQTLMLPVLLLAASGHERRVAEVAEKIADDLGLSVNEREEMLPSGRQRLLHNRIHWAKFYMTKAGLITSPSRGRFIATEVGHNLFAGHPAHIDVSMLLKYQSFREFYKNETSSDRDVEAPTSISQAEVSSTPQDKIEGAYQEFHTAPAKDLLERIAQNSPTFFEYLIVELLVAMGYGGSHKNATEQLGRTGDGGVDGVINEDRLGLDRVYIQAKHYAVGSNVGRPDVQSFVGSLVGLGASKGVFVTTSSFSAGAREFVRHLTQRIILVDGKALADLMIEHGVGVRTFQNLKLSRLDEDFFSSEEEYFEEICQ